MRRRTTLRKGLTMTVAILALLGLWLNVLTRMIHTLWIQRLSDRRHVESSGKRTIVRESQPDSENGLATDKRYDDRDTPPV